MDSNWNIIVGWLYTTFNWVTRNNLARITNTWALDTSFTWSFGDSSVYDLIEQPDGKVLVVWWFVTFNGVARNKLARVTSTWVLDSTFTGSFATNGAVINTILLQPDVK